jgi:tetratricopeptide (TPR) repeat protein
LAVYLFLLFWVGRFSKGILFGGLWFVVVLLPILNIIPIPWPMVIERFSYVPSLGFALVIGFLGDLLMGLSLVTTPPRVRRGIVGLFMMVLVLFSVMTVMRNRVWSDEILLWEDTVQKAPRFALGHMNLGLAYHERGDLERAAKSYEESLKYDPSAPKIYHNLGKLYQDMGRMDQALEQYQRLIDLGQALPHTYYNMGIIYENKGSPDRALSFYREALKRAPDYYKAHLRLGRMLERFGNRQEALQEYREALRIYPKESTAYLDLAEVLHSLGRLKEAEEAYSHFIDFSTPEMKGSEKILFVQKRLEELRRRQGQSDH